MGLMTKKQEVLEEPESFTVTSKYINDELDLIQVQQENIVSVASQLEKAFSQAENMRRFLKIMKKTDKILLSNIEDRRKKESGMTRAIEEVKGLLRNQRYEDIDRMMSSIHRQSQVKVRLSQEELNELRQMMTRLNEFYQEAAGFCRLSQLVYVRLSQIYESCQSELNTEISEEEELSKAGAYAGSGGGKVVKSQSFKDLLGNGVQSWFTRY